VWEGGGGNSAPYPIAPTASRTRNDAQALLLLLAPPCRYMPA